MPSGSGCGRSCRSATGVVATGSGRPTGAGNFCSGRSRPQRTPGVRSTGTSRSTRPSSVRASASIPRIDELPTPRVRLCPGKPRLRILLYVEGTADSLCPGRWRNDGRAWWPCVVAAPSTTAPRPRQPARQLGRPQPNSLTGGPRAGAAAAWWRRGRRLVRRQPPSIGRFALGGIGPAAHVPVDRLPHLPPQMPVRSGIHPFRREDGIGEAVRVSRRCVPQPTVLARGKAEAEVDTEIVEEELNLGLPVARGHGNSIAACSTGSSTA